MAQKQEVTVIPECFVDTNLTETLIGMACNHQKGCATVTKQMKEKCADGLKKETKQQDSKKDPRFKRLFIDLLSASNISLMKALITYLLEHKYDADVMLMKGMVK